MLALEWRNGEWGGRRERGSEAVGMVAGRRVSCVTVASWFAVHMAVEAEPSDGWRSMSCVHAFDVREKESERDRGREEGV